MPTITARDRLETVAEAVSMTGRYFGVPINRQYRPAGADAAVGQPDPESSLQTGGARSLAVFGTWVEIRISDRGGKSRNSPARRDAAVTA
jgi:hypothetical protein